MTGIDDELQIALHNDRYPRSSRYDARWLVDNLMGPHPLWMVEFLTEVMRIEPGMRVLDLGCGSALTSIFLAREFDVQVWALDLWTEATEQLGSDPRVRFGWPSAPRERRCREPAFR